MLDQKFLKKVYEGKNRYLEWYLKPLIRLWLALLAWQTLLPLPCFHMTFQFSGVLQFSRVNLRRNPQHAFYRCEKAQKRLSCSGWSCDLKINVYIFNWPYTYFTKTNSVLRSENGLCIYDVKCLFISAIIVIRYW